MKIRLLFYTNEWERVKEFIKHYNTLLKNGYEVAFSTDSIEIAKRLSVGRMLVVKPGTYDADITVSTNKLEEYPDALTFNQFMKVMEDE